MHSSLRLLSKLCADVERLVADQDIRGRHVHLEGLPRVLEQRLQSKIELSIVALDVISIQLTLAIPRNCMLA